MKLTFFLSSVFFLLIIISVTSDDLISVSQISPKSAKLDENNILYQSSLPSVLPSTVPLQTIINAENDLKSSSASTHVNNSNAGESQLGKNNKEDDNSKINNNRNLDDTESESEEVEFSKVKRVERSASPILHNSNEIPSNVNYAVDFSAQNHIDPVHKKHDDASGRYFSLIQPTSTIGADANDALVIASGGMTNSDSEVDLLEKSFLSKRGPRLIPSGSPSPRQITLNETTSITTSIKPSSVTQTVSPTVMEDATDLARQNSNPDIQDIITGIVKLLNGNVNVHTNTQPYLAPTRRPYTTRINNRGPPRISDVQPLPQENVYEQPLSSTIRPPPPPYPFDRPEGPIRPFLTGVPLPEQIVPSANSNNNNYRPSFISQPPQSRPPWQRPRPRPPIQTIGNRRPILTPPPYKFGTRPTSTEQALLEEEAFFTTSNSNDSVEIERPSNTTLSYEVTEPLEHEQTILDGNQTNPTKDELSKKKDKFKKPNPSTSLNLKVDAAKSQSSNSMIMKTIIQTTSEINTAQYIPIPTETTSAILSPSSLVPSIPPSSSAPVIESSVVEPSDDIYSYKIASEETIMKSTIQTPPLSSIKSTTLTTTENYSKLPVLEPIRSSVVASHSATTTTQPAVGPPAPPSFHPRPGIVLDDPEFKPGNHDRPKVKPTRTMQTHQVPQPTHSAGLPPGYGEIFDVTLSAIQGPGSGKEEVHTINIKPYGVGPGDIIVSASGDDSFVSIDGKRTYINLFGEATAAPNQLEFAKKPATDVPTKTQSIQPTKSVSIMTLHSVLFLLA